MKWIFRYSKSINNYDLLSDGLLENAKFLLGYVMLTMYKI